ncbi:C45 family peptidase [Clostridium sp. chh4-2]|uniref:C45 family autoproteolytic acyltransferase/hydolase n=1 Tax=Clostridium sp. chh4-2 TaxID=2067550 RepID=UPI000CD04573|nr:C45 family peptidase [Clostridium sp. chh4-2]
MFSQMNYENGKKTGKQCADSIAENIRVFFRTAEAAGYSEEAIHIQAEFMKKDLSPSRYEEVRGIAEGAKVDFGRLLAYNLLQQKILPEGCTVFFAAGSSSSTGATIIGKNSDKGGDELFTGKNCYKLHEINVVSYFENEDGSHIVGVSAAGTTGIKMGLNSHGVAAATNFGYSSEIKRKSLSTEDKFAGDRAQIARDALQHKTALEAAQYAASRLIARPMASSGILEFADADEVYIVENAYEYVAVNKITNAVDSRSNYFVTLDKLNEPGNASCYCRYHRSQKMLAEVEGHVTVDDLKQISMDHHDGTGSVGICRHLDGIQSSTQSSAIMELNREHPEKSLIHVALGKPCNAWRNEDGHVTISMDMKREELPEEFLCGEPYKKYCMAEPIFN